MKRLLQASLWLATYLALVLTPLVVLLAVPLPAKGGFWWEVGIGLGFAGLTMLAMQFLLTARLRGPTAPFGIDVIYYFHRFLGYVLLALVLLHPLILLAMNPDLRAELNPFSGSWAMLSGLLSVLLLLVLVVSSVWRKRLRIPYNRWRRGHLALALVVIALAFVHMWSVNYYSASPVVLGLWAVIALSVLIMVIETRLVRPWRLLRKPWRVQSVTPERGESWTVTLAPENHQGIRFLPGQFAWLSIGHSPFIMEEHPFSIASAPCEDGTLQFTIKALGDFTGTLGAIQAGTRVCVDGPYGVFSCDRYPQAPGYIFIAGGIGVAPIIAMLEALAARHDTRPLVLFAAHSRWERIPRRDDIASLSARLNLKIVNILEVAPPEWEGETGWLTHDILTRHLPEDHVHHEYFICGPAAMTHAAEHFLNQLGVPMTRIHNELFDMA